MADVDSSVDLVLKFYKHSNDKNEIGWKTCDDLIKGPNLKEAFKALGKHGLRERSHVYSQQGGWSGDLYVVHRRLFSLQNETALFMGHSGAGGDLRANIYEVVMNSTSGWAQYLSLVLKGPFDEKIADELGAKDFAPKHSYLAKNDPVPRTSTKDRLWLDDFVEPRFL